MLEKTFPEKLTGQLKKWMAAIAAATMMLPGTMAVPAAENTQSNLPQEELTVHFIDVGQGLAIMAKAGDDVLVYDGGNSDAASYFVSYLKDEGIEDIDYMIASHYDADHLNGLVGALHAFDTETIIAPDYKHNSKLYTSFYNTLSSQNKEVTYPEVGQEYEFGEGSFTVLGPTQIRDDSNNNAVTDWKAFFCGDAEQETVSKLIDEGLLSDIDVLKVAHHGSKESLSDTITSELSPDIALISVGENNRYGHPTNETLSCLENAGCIVARTDLNGDVICSFTPEKITVKTLR